MRHQTRRRTFGRRPEQRKALLRGLADQLIAHDRIQTTLIKAKELRKVVEPLVTLAKRGDLHARRLANSVLYTQNSLKRLFDQIGPRFKDRQGGYTRILKTGFRRGDGAPTAIIEFVDHKVGAKKNKDQTAAKTSKAASAKTKKVEKKETKAKGKSQKEVKKAKAKA